jgi:hypothetical protein
MLDSIYRSSLSRPGGYRGSLLKVSPVLELQDCVGEGGQTADFSGMGGESEVCYCGEGDVGDVETFYPLVLLFIL